MTQLEFDERMQAINAEQKVATQKDNEIIEVCNMQVQKLELDIAETRVLIQKAQLQRREAIARREKIYAEYHAKKHELCQKYPKSSMEKTEE